MAHERFRTTIDECLDRHGSDGIAAKLRKTGNHLAEHLDDSTISAVGVSPELRRANVALDQAIGRSADAITTRGRIDMGDAKVNAEAVAYARRQVAVLGLAYMIGCELIDRTEMNFEEAAEEGVRSLEAERARRFEPKAQDAQGAIEPDGPPDIPPEADGSPGEEPRPPGEPPWTETPLVVPADPPTVPEGDTAGPAIEPLPGTVPPLPSLAPVRTEPDGQAEDQPGPDGPAVTYPGVPGSPKPDQPGGPPGRRKSR